MKGMKSISSGGQITQSLNYESSGSMSTATVSV
jgi:hypothetical protein